MNGGGTYLRDPATGQIVQITEATKPAPLTVADCAQAADGDAQAQTSRKRGTSSHKEG